MVAALFVRGRVSGSIMWNLSSEVGQGKRNNADDVELVRLGYFSMRKDPKAQTFLNQREKDALAKLRSKGPFDQDLDECIRAHQASRGGTQDGFISVAKYTEANTGLYDHKNRWIIIVLNTNMLHMIPQYPRIDLSDDAGKDLSSSVASICHFEK
ncbi:hypothetical protein [Bradyrhizobium lablabi]|uniref:hypothetical protein n=1 Tax=Bradyrhizobium lablabi TaxID=722472 RepID=UPI001BAE1880|nr:hypothetical protein [Bradyrhizobium lablabi]MBR0696392.1 hypothetical protein [Bradyrhizobium lablabi]